MSTRSTCQLQHLSNPKYVKSEAHQSEALEAMNVGRSALSAMALAVAAALTAFEAQAQARDCTGSSAGPATAARVVDGRSFILADGREVRLADVETVLPVPGDEDEARVAAALAAKTALEKLVLNGAVDVAVTSAGSDRYGRLTAYVFANSQPGQKEVQGQGIEFLVQHELLAAGHAVVAPVSASPCRRVLQTAEREARARGLGVWGTSYSVIKNATDPADILGDQGRFAVVQGKVVSVHESAGLVYINFAQRWRDQFTVTLLRRNESRLTAPKTLAGHTIEVRGFIEERGGPTVEVTRPEQIDIIH
jgi:endonuclease YncB( thermonuclease family)